MTHLCNVRFAFKVFLLTSWAPRNAAFDSKLIHAFDISLSLIVKKRGLSLPGHRAWVASMFSLFEFDDWWHLLFKICIDRLIIHKSIASFHGHRALMSFHFRSLKLNFWCLCFFVVNLLILNFVCYLSCHLWSLVILAEIFFND